MLRGEQNTFIFSDTDQLGVYHVLEGTQETAAQHFAVNLFDSRESNLKPRDAFTIKHESVEGESGLEAARQETWKWILMLGLFVLILEWYVYNKRVYF